MGHTVERCYELVGYPQSYKSKPGQGNNQGYKANSSVSNKTTFDTQTTSSTITTHVLTPDQITQLLGLLKEKKYETSQTANFGGNSINFFSSCVFHKPVFGFANCPSENSGGWIIDSRANQHMVKSDKGLINLVDVSNFNISVKHPNGTNAKVSKIGCLGLTEKITLSNVFVVPGYCVNLMPVYKLICENKLIVSFDEHNCYLQDLHTKRILVTGNQIDGLYFCGDASKSVKDSLFHF